MIRKTKMVYGVRNVKSQRNFMCGFCRGTFISPPHTRWYADKHRVVKILGIPVSRRIEETRLACSARHASVLEDRMRRFDKR